MAYQKKGSRASLIASGSIAAALLLGAALMTGNTRVAGTLLALGKPQTLSSYPPPGIVLMIGETCIAAMFYAFDVCSQPTVAQDEPYLSSCTSDQHAFSAWSVLASIWHPMMRLSLQAWYVL